MLCFPAMKLEGSCQCGKVQFTVDSETPFPFMFCYCSICRKTTGGPCGCNIMGIRKSLAIKGRRYLKSYHAVMREKGKRPRRSKAERWFCGACGTHLYLLDDEWPDGVWPNAGAIDTPLPEPHERVHIMLKDKPKWVPQVSQGRRYPKYPDFSIAEWHEQHRKR